MITVTDIFAGAGGPDIDSVMRPKAWCPVCEQVVASRQAWKPGRTVGRYRAQYVYVCDLGHVVEPGWLPASVAIDWSLEGQRIGDRTKPLSPKTMARIREGLRRYGHQFVIEAGGNQYDAADPKHAQYGNLDSYYRAWPITDPLRTLHTSMTKGLVGSLLIPRWQGSKRERVRLSGNAASHASGGLRGRPRWRPLRPV